MKILIVTKAGLSLGLAQRLALEGHSVEVYSDAFPMVSTGNGIYSISTNLWKSIQACKFIVSDVGNNKTLYKRAAMYNKPIVGCTEVTDYLNADAVKEYQLGNKAGVAFPPSELYDDALGLSPVLT